MNQSDVNTTQYSFTDDDVSIKELLTPLWSRRWKILFFTLLITLVVVFYTSLLKPAYKASAVLQIGSNISSKNLSINDAFSNNNANEQQIQTQYELLRSRKIAERVIVKMNLLTNNAFISNKYNNKLPFLTKDNPKKINLADAVKRFQSLLTISPITNTELVKITFSSYSPKLAMQVANQIGRTYLQYQDELYSSSKESKSQWLVDQLEELGRKLETSELALQAFRESESLVDVKGISGLINSEITELTSTSLKAEKLAADLLVTYDFVSKHRGNLQKLIELNEINSHRSYMQLKDSEESAIRKQSELSKRYGPKHPKQVAIAAELVTIGERIEQQVQELAQSLEKNYYAAQEQVKATKLRLERAKGDFLRLSRLENKFSQLQREVDTNKELYNNYLVRLKETDAMGNYKAAFYVRFLDKAIKPEQAYAPKKSLIVIVSFVLAMVLASIYIIMRELLMDTLNSRRKLDSFSEAPVLAVLPKFKAKSSAVDEKYPTDNRFTEAVRTLRTSLLFSSEKKPPKVIAITSSVPSEGKSTVALHLARSFSEMEKVLLIEADLRHPTVAKNLKLDQHRPGLSNLLAKTHQINECIVRDSHMKLDILTSGISPANPLAFLSMKRFDMLIKVFGNFYDRIIIETPPVNAVSDAVIISRLVESVLYVVHGDKTRREQITSGLRMLKQVKAPIEGIVINQSQNIDTNRYQTKYYNDMANIIKLPVRKQA